LKKAKEKNVKLHFPVDWKCAQKMDENSEVKLFDLKSGIPEGWEGYDHGEKSNELFKKVLD